MAYEEIIKKALALWNFKGADYNLISGRENNVFRVDYKGEPYALRIHRKGYHSNEEIWSELQWMTTLAKGGLSVPIPVLSSSKKSLDIVEGHQVDILTWLPGSPLGKTTEPLEHTYRTGLFRSIGQEMAQMHTLADEWTPPIGFTRNKWDRNGLLGDNPIWGRFWENPTLSSNDRKLFSEVREIANNKLKGLENELDYGLIHADLVRENILIDGNKVQLIDFDDSGFGFRLFDLATTLLKNLDEPDYTLLRDSLIDGYKLKRNIDETALNLFLLIRAATYVGWIMNRIEEKGSQVRNERFILNTRKMAKTYRADQ